MTTSSPGTRLFGRAVSLVIGAPNDPSLDVSAAFNDSNAHGLDVSGFDLDFVVERTLKPEPNTLAVSVFNLAEASRQQISGVQKLTARLEVGYQGGTELIYFGYTRAAWTERDGANFVTHVEIQPGIVPGALVNVDSLFVNGGYRVERCRWHGSTYSQDWTCELECKKY